MKRSHLALALAALAALAAFPLAVGNPYYLHLVETIMIYAIVLFGLDIVVGYTGQVSLGHAGLFGIGAYSAGVLIAPLTLTGATMGAVLGLKAFAVAIIGGLTSGMGIVVGGLLLGIAETTTGFYISTGYKDVPGLVLLLIVLALKPAGLFGKTAIKKV